MVQGSPAMAPGLRNEDYIAFLDESGEDGLQVVAGVLIPARWLRSAERRWRDFIRDRLGSRSGRTEVKARDLLAGSRASLHAQRRALADHGLPLSAKAAGGHFYREALEHIASITEVRVLSVGLQAKHPVEVYRLWCPTSPGEQYASTCGCASNQSLQYLLTCKQLM
jgi:hypothetical protein